jgi:hypothetical protein
MSLSQINVTVVTALSQTLSLVYNPLPTAAVVCALHHVMVSALLQYNCTAVLVLVPEVQLPVPETTAPGLVLVPLPLYGCLYSGTALYHRTCSCAGCAAQRCDAATCATTPQTGSRATGSHGHILIGATKREELFGVRLIKAWRGVRCAAYSLTQSIATSQQRCASKSIPTAVVWFAANGSEGFLAASFGGFYSFGISLR